MLSDGRGIHRNLYRLMLCFGLFPDCTARHCHQSVPTLSYENSHWKPNENNNSQSILWICWSVKENWFFGNFILTLEHLSHPATIPLMVYSLYIYILKLFMNSDGSQVWKDEILSDSMTSRQLSLVYKNVIFINGIPDS